MTNPIYNQPASGPGGVEQSLAASASLIITGLEKDLNQKINNINTQILDPKTRLEALEEYIERLSAATVVDEIQKRKERERGGQEQKPPSKRRMAQKTKPKKQTPSKSIELKTKLSAAPADAKALDPKVLREYIILQAKKQTGIPPEEQEEVNRQLVEIEENLKKESLPSLLLSSHQSEIEKVIRRELFNLIKNALLSNLENLTLASEKMLSIEDPNQLLRIISGEATPEDYSIKELVELAKNTGVNLDHWIAYWNYEKIRINTAGNVIITPQTEEEKNLLKDGLRTLYARFFLAQHWLEKIRLYLQILKETNRLKSEGTPDLEIAEIIRQARHLAWLKIISLLKDCYLKRILSASETEFLLYSKEIANLTQKARGLSVETAEKGHHLIETKLETLSFETARYKLELLKSMQNVDYSKEREKGIQWLEHLISKLPKL